MTCFGYYQHDHDEHQLKFVININNNNISYKLDGLGLQLQLFKKKLLGFYYIFTEPFMSVVICNNINNILLYTLAT